MSDISSRNRPYAVVVYNVIGFFRTMSDNVAKQMKGFKRKPPSRRRHLVHKSGISRRRSSPVVRTLAYHARGPEKDNSLNLSCVSPRWAVWSILTKKLRNYRSVGKSLRRPIVLGCALKSFRKKISRFCFLKIGRSP